MTEGEDETGKNDKDEGGERESVEYDIYRCHEDI